MNRHLVYARSSQWAALIARAEELMAGRCFRLLKDNGRTKAGFLTVPGEGAVFIKCVGAHSWAGGLIGRLQGSRAARSLRGAVLLKTAGFARPEPLAALEVRAAGSVRASYLASEALCGARMLSTFALGGGQNRNFARRRRIFEAVAREVRRLHDRGLYTRDMQETNLMLEEREGAFRIYFVDLEDFRRVGAVSWRRRRLNLIHLDRSIGRFVGRTTRLRFLYDYLGGRPQKDAARRLVSQLLALHNRLDRRRGTEDSHRGLPAFVRRLIRHGDVARAELPRTGSPQG
jgi:Lipopolysaccharide kinase (Kdo/WaaP) family